jgi:hypothetical protein
MAIADGIMRIKDKSQQLWFPCILKPITPFLVLKAIISSAFRVKEFEK